MKRKKKPHNFSREERQLMYIPYLAKGMSRRAIAEATGIPEGTVKYDLYVSGKSLSTASQPATDPLDLSGSSSIQGSDKWKKSLSEIAGICKEIFLQSVHGSIKCDKCGNEVVIGRALPEARRFAETFASLYRSRLSSVKVNIQNINIEELKNNTQYNQFIQNDRIALTKRIFEIVERVAPAEVMIQIHQEIKNLEVNEI